MWTLIKIASIILMFLLNCSSWLIVNFNKILFHKTVVLCLQSQLVDALWTFFKSLQLKLPIHVHDCRTWRAADHYDRRFPNLSQFQHFLKSYNITKISVKYYGSSISDKDQVLVIVWAQVLVIVWAGAEVDPSVVLISQYIHSRIKNYLVKQLKLSSWPWFGQFLLRYIPRLKVNIACWSKCW